MATIYVSRWMAWVERRRAALVLGEPIPGVYRSPTGGFLSRLKALFSDPSTWKDLAWHLLLLPVGIADFTIAVTAWSATLGPDHHAGLVVGAARSPTRPSSASSRSTRGATPSWPWRSASSCCRWPRRSCAARRPPAARSRASCSAPAAASSRSASRSWPRRAPAPSTPPRPSCSASSATCTTARRRASSRWRSTSGMAEERFDRDPEGARELVEKARGEARLAMGELRDLARGIRPALLVRARPGRGDRRARGAHVAADDRRGRPRRAPARAGGARRPTSPSPRR